MDKIVCDGRLLALKIGQDDIPEGLGFFTDETNYIQVGSWNYSAGKQLLAHNHNFVERFADRTQEAVIVLSGKVRAIIYDEKDNPVGELMAEGGEALILLEGGHAYEVVQDGTRVFEVKNGPYPGAEKDRRRLV